MSIPWQEWPEFKASHPDEAVIAKRDAREAGWLLGRCLFRLDLYGRISVALCHPY